MNISLRQTHVRLLIVAMVILIIFIMVVTHNSKQIYYNYYNYHSTIASPSQPVLTLTRLGSELEFDYSSCPSSSVMLNSTQLNAASLHDDCPHVFIIGARKGGTTAMYHYLSGHPDFGGVRLDKGPSAGETFYFQRHFFTTPWSVYVSQFPSDKMSGDSSVGNLVDCHLPQRLYSSCGRKVKLVVLLRDPVERFQSDFRMMARLDKGQYGPKNISDVVKQNINSFSRRVSLKKIKIGDLRNYPNELTCFYRPAKNMMFEGLYYIHLHNWLCNFPAENILILNTEQMKENSVRGLAEVMKFVGLRPLEDHVMKEITSVKYNYAGKLEDELSVRKLTMSDRKKLMTVYEPFNNKLFQLLKWNMYDLGWNKISE